MAQIQESKNLNDINLLIQQTDLNNKEDILTDKKMQTLFFNLLNNAEIILPKINSFSNYMIFLNYIFKEFQVNEISSIELSRKNEILNLLAEELINQAMKIDHIIDKEKLVQYFYDKNFFSFFLENWQKNEDISLFKGIFSRFIEVSKYFLLK